jgi:hypothetical protein
VTAISAREGKAVEGQVLLSEQQIAAVLLILSSLVFVVGAILYTGRAMLRWPAAEAPGYLIWERGFVMAAVVINVLGLVLLESLLRGAGDQVVARLALVTYALGVAVILVAEASTISGQEGLYPQTVTYVVLAFLAQAAFGVSLLLTGFLPAWVGWATLAWNLGWLVVLPIVSPRDVYYPVLHHVAPLLIGIALLVKR